MVAGMRSPMRFAHALLVITLTFSALSQNPPEKPAGSKKVCVAEINNQTTQSLMPERLTKELARGLMDAKIFTVVMESSTTSDRNLHPTVENGEELKSNECDYIVLTQIRDPRLHPTEMRSPQISIGGKVPSIDASDPSSAPARENLEVDFALFHPGNPESVLNTQILDRPSSNAGDSMMQAMDHEANRIRHELKKK